ncbi:MAG: 4Fe-4S dicluster domain-containing protein [Nitrospirae bacterium]|nr:4Fe-4S dicluster domain-containing protein [Nitrospirota bacterium]
MITRRKLITNTLKGMAALSLPAAAFEILTPERLNAIIYNDTAKVRYVFLVDTNKCVGCGLCVKACKNENEIPYEANVTRTWVERYIITRDERHEVLEKVFADSPKGARDGFITGTIDLGHGNTYTPRKEDIDKAFFVPKLCNQCDNPACVQVCPVGATYQADDGVVLIDRKWCIGCGYCVMGCPYGVRFFHPQHHVADKCNFCYHRIKKGMKTACVEACPFGARLIGNYKDPDDAVTRIINTKRVGVLKEEFGTRPQVFYLGLSMEVR